MPAAAPWRSNGDMPLGTRTAPDKCFRILAGRPAKPLFASSANSSHGERVARGRRRERVPAGRSGSPRSRSASRPATSTVTRGRSRAVGGSGAGRDGASASRWRGRRWGSLSGAPSTVRRRGARSRPGSERGRPATGSRGGASDGDEPGTDRGGVGRPAGDRTVLIPRSPESV
jgi:hypothetical protein